MTFKQIRSKASDICKRNTGILVLISLIYTIIMGAVSVSTSSEDLGVSIITLVLSVANLLITGPMTYGFINVVIKNNNGEKPSVKDLFAGFKYFGQLFVLNLLLSIYIVLWGLLLIIPGIIKSIAYSRAFYIFYENPTLSAKECIKQSMGLMKGHKWEYFCLMFSYIGWFILCALTLGILTLWVLPKVETADYIFYNLINGKEEAQEAAE